jgi:hypothetical protein
MTTQNERGGEGEHEREETLQNTVSPEQPLSSQIVPEPESVAPAPAPASFTFPAAAVFSFVSGFEHKRVYKQLLWLVFDHISETNTGRLAYDDFDERLWKIYQSGKNSDEDELYLTPADWATLEFLVRSSGGYWLDLNATPDDDRDGDGVRLVTLAEWEHILTKRHHYEPDEVD